MVLVLAILLVVALGCLIIQATGIDDRMDGIE
jgi:hypothetical protein